MNVIGINETALRSLINNVTVSSFTETYSVCIHLFREANPNDDITSLNLDLSSTTVNLNFSKLSEKCDGIMFANLTVTKSAGKVRLVINPIASDLPYTSSEVFYKGIASRDLYDHQAAASQTLGDCLMYNVNNIVSVTRTTSIAMPPVLTKIDKWSSPFAVYSKGCYAGRSRSEGQGHELHIGLRHYPGLAYAGAAAAVFDAPVEADFVFFDVFGYGNVLADRNITLEVQNVDNSFTSIGNFNVSAISVNRFNFTKRTIKGIRLASNYADVGANHYCNYYLYGFTAGLRDYTASPLNSISRPAYTKAVMSLNLNPTDVQNSHRLPLMTLSIGDVNSSADFKLAAPTSFELSRNSFAQQTILELEA